MYVYEPYYHEAEEVLVGSFFLDSGLVKECTILPEQLYSTKLRLIYSAIRSLDEKGIPVDFITVVEELGSHIEAIGGVSYLSQLADSVPTTANFHFYEKLVKEYAQKRKTIQIAEKIMEQAREAEISKVLSEGIANLRRIEEDGADDETEDIVPALVDLYFSCEKDQGDLNGIPSGFTELDRLTGGFQESDLVIIGARPSMGKTAFALHLALHAATNDISIIFSLEMSKIQLLKRMACFTGKIDSLKMKNPRKDFQEEDWFRFSEAIGKLSKTNLHLFDRAGMDVPYIWSKVRKIRSEAGKQKRILVVIDYLQLIKGDPNYKQNRYAEISEISRSLKTMARELNVVVIALSQLSRGVESRQDKRPILSDLRESGQIEQDADLIAFLYRDDYYTKDSLHKDRMEIILAKHRNGPTGTVELGFHKKYGEFFNLKDDKSKNENWERINRQ
ncbi:replicative DNA helicase [Neobacillus fumarioli]|uniref:replicative DNA helicase n=1 Tax=Neobacillus fumarioli TaxID=105229 RepID=UPI0008359E7C|nr:replicative DNA helicase [Neobacillus fumarioli]